MERISLPENFGFRCGNIKLINKSKAYHLKDINTIEDILDKRAKLPDRVFSLKDFIESTPGREFSLFDRISYQSSLRFFTMSQFVLIVDLANELCYEHIKIGYIQIIFDNVTLEFKRILFMQMYYEYLKRVNSEYKTLKRAVKNLTN